MRDKKLNQTVHVCFFSNILGSNKKCIWLKFDYFRLITVFN